MRLFTLLFRLLATLPLPILHLFGTIAGWLAYGVCPTYRNRLKTNITKAGYAHLLSRAIAESGKMICELPFIWYAPRHRVMTKIQVNNWAVVESALKQETGLIFLTPHLGCFEISAQVVAAHTCMTVLYRPPHKAIVKFFVEKGRARSNLVLAPTNYHGVRMLLKALKRGKSVGLLPDQVPQPGQGVWIDFFCRPAYTMVLPTRLQQTTQAPIFLAYAKRLPWGRGYQVDIIPFEASGETLEQQTHAINIAMEKLIARCPEQYLWSYNRYKRPKSAVSPV